MIGLWDLKLMLERKYALEAQRNSIAQQEADSMGAFRKVQGGLVDANADLTRVQAGLAPRAFEVDSAYKGAQTQGLLTENAWAPKRYQSEIDLSRANASESYSRGGLAAAQRTRALTTLGDSYGQSPTESLGLPRRRPLGGTSGGLGYGWREGTEAPRISWRY